MGMGSLVTSWEAGEGIREKQIAGLLKNASASETPICARFPSLAALGCVQLEGSNGLCCTGSFFGCIISVLLLK